MPKKISKETDYHEFTTINTPAEERKRLNVGNIWMNSAKCLKCGDVLVSKNRHHMPHCSCGNLAVDGGSWYCKRMSKDHEKVEVLTVLFNDIKEDK